MRILHHILNRTASHCPSVPPAVSILLLSFPLCVPSSHFISIPLSPPLPNQVLGRGGGIMCAGVLICHMGPWSCNQNSFWANLCPPFEHDSLTHTGCQVCQNIPFQILPPNITHMPNHLSLFHEHYTLIYYVYPINNTGSI